MSTQKELEAAAQQVAKQRQSTQRLHDAYRGKPSSAYMSAKAAEALSKRLSSLYVNFPRLVVNSIAERCQIQSFRRAGQTAADLQLWQLWKLAGMEAKSDTVHIDRALYGSAYVTVWGTAADPKRPAVMVDTPRSAAVETDPATGEVLSLFRTWKHGDKVYGAQITQDRLQTYRTEGSELETARWEPFREAQRNPWGRVPTVPFVRNGSSTEAVGVSAATDVLDLTDALAKIMQDTLVTSEYHSRPRRWATGLELQEDENGNPIDPFGETRLMQSEDPDTRFGQLQAAELSGYENVSAMLTQHIGSLTGLPPHYLGLHGDQPANADGTRAAETQLVARAETEKRAMSQPWAEVAAWLDAVANSKPEPASDVVSIWESSETRTPAAAADAAAKLHGLGVPLRSLLRDPLRYEPHEIDTIDKDYATEMARRQAFSGFGQGT